MNNVMSIEHVVGYIYGIHIGLRNGLKSVALLEFSTTDVRYPF